MAIFQRYLTEILEGWYCGPERATDALTRPKHCIAAGNIEVMKTNIRRQMLLQAGFEIRDANTLFETFKANNTTASPDALIKYREQLTQNVPDYVQITVTENDTQCYICARHGASTAVISLIKTDGVWNIYVPPPPVPED